MKKVLIREMFAAIVVLLISCGCYAQKGDYTTKSKAAQKYYETAQRYYDNRDNDNAKSALHDALSKDSNFVEALMLQSAVFADEGNYLLAIASLQKAVSINPDFFVNNWYSLGRFQLIAAQYDQGLISFSKFLSDKTISNQLHNEASYYKSCCEFAIQSVAQPVDFKPASMGSAINTDANEYYPTILLDGSEFYFTRSRFGSRGGIEQEDFYIAKYKDGQWQMAQNAGEPLNTATNEGAATISADGSMLFFTACNRPDGQGSCDIYYTRKTAIGWAEPKNLGAKVNTASWESQPSFSSDGKSVYFIRGIYDENRKKRTDIYVSNLGNDGFFQTPVKLSNVINTERSEESVFIHPDNKTLYFSSSGHVGMGGLDIYMAMRKDDGTWGKPVNLGFPINTEADENSFIVSADGSTAYFASDREGGAGGLDLYSFALPAKLKPQPVTYARGHIFDKSTNQNLDAKYELIDAANGSILKWANANHETGTFILALQKGNNYILNVTQPGYLFYTDSFQCTTNADYNKPYRIEVPLQKLTSGATMVLKNVFFDSGKFDLKPESNTELTILFNFLNQNPNTKIEISGHTDNTGLAATNLTLSENRAKAVFNYLQSKGIDPLRLKYKGYGDKMPIGDNQTEGGRALNRRTEIKVL
ncbi:MAG: PD40 domain-containing protein [Bacteroidetes bacterium]|nr:PD40 domain-containing protein [Bacteroidota bacterium]